MLFFAGPESRVRKALADLFGDVLERTTHELEGVKTVHDLTAKVAKLQADVSELEIKRAQKQEEFDRREREVEHKVGLERKRQEFELTAAKREATLTVREENLAADRKRFEEQMQFHDKRFTTEVEYLKGALTYLTHPCPGGYFDRG